MPDITKRPIKPPRTFAEQVQLLKQRGLILDDQFFVEQILSEANYYRLSAYLLPFKDPITGCYRPNIHFKTIYNIYEFDRKFRGLILSAIEPIEILLRTRIAYYHAHNYGPEGYMLADNFENKDYHIKFVAEFERIIEKNQKNLFVKHHIENYGGKFPLWVAVELFSFGMLSKFYANMKTEDRKSIAKELNTGADYLKSWLISITDLRNRCAHYMRLYFHKLVVSPKLPKGIYREYSGRVFDIIYVMKYLYLSPEKWRNEFVRPLEALLDTYQEHLQAKYIGFPDNWLKLLD